MYCSIMETDQRETSVSIPVAANGTWLVHLYPTGKAFELSRWSQPGKSNVQCVSMQGRIGGSTQLSENTHTTKNDPMHGLQRNDQVCRESSLKPASEGYKLMLSL
jgi:hypothetical protein